MSSAPARPQQVPTVTLSVEDRKRLDEVRKSIERGEPGIPHEDVMRELEDRKRRGK